MAQVRGGRPQTLLRPRPGVAAPGRPGHITIYVVRHAHAGDRSTWSGDDRLRPLTGKGWKQAAALADGMGSVQRLLSSPYVRCRQTLEPLSQRLGLPIEDEERLMEGTPFSQALAVITGRGPEAAMSTHGDIVDDLVAHLIGAGLTTPAQAGGSKASTWRLEIENGEITAARYIPPPR